MSRFSVSTSEQHTATISSQQNYDSWPTSFPKPVIGIERTGVLCQENFINTSEDFQFLPGALEAIKLIRMKGYKLVLFFNEPRITSGEITTDQVDHLNNYMMQVFGQAGILSINGLLYSTSLFKEDLYVMPNTGMLKRAEKDFKVKFDDGYLAGNKISSLKAAEAVGARPVLIKSGNYDEALDKLNTFANRKLKSKVKIFYSLLDFAKSLK